MRQLPIPRARTDLRLGAEAVILIEVHLDAVIQSGLASTGLEDHRLLGESDFDLADSTHLSVGKQALTGFVPCVQGSLLKLKLLSSLRWRSYRLIV